MFFTQLAFLTLSASAAYVVNLAKRDLGPPIATLNAITAQLETIDFDVDPENLNSASNTSAAFVVDGAFQAVNTITVDGSLQVQACVASAGTASAEDAATFINAANTTYVPTLLTVLNKTSAAKPIFAQDSLPNLDLVAVILADLQRYNASNELYLGNLTDATPPQYLFDVMQIRQVIAQAFSETIGAYGCPGVSTDCSGTTNTTTTTGVSSTSTHSSSASISSSSSVSPVKVKSITSSTSTSTASHTTTAPPASSSTSVAPALGQCGGLGWTGPTTCVPGYICVNTSQSFAQCLPTADA